MKLNRFFQGLLGLLAIVLIVFVGAKARNAVEEYNYVGKAVRDRDVISIEGTGKVSAKPDLARIDLGVQTDGTTVQQAQSENTRKMNDIIAALKKMNIAADDIQTSNYNLYPKIDYTAGKQNIIGYTVSQQVTIKVRELDKAGDVLAKAGELGANQISGLQFTIDDPKVLQAEARDKAIEDARKKAEALAKQLGLTIIKVVTFSESGYGQPPMPMYSMAKEGMGGGGGTPQVESGSLDVTSNVVVTFEVR